MKNVNKLSIITKELFKNIVVGFCENKQVSISKNLSYESIVALHNQLCRYFGDNLPGPYQDCTDCLIDLIDLLEDFYDCCGNNFININQLNTCINVAKREYKIEERDSINLYGIIIRNNAEYFKERTEEDLEKIVINSDESISDEKTREKLIAMKNVYSSICNFVDSNGRFIAKEYVEGDVLNLCEVGLPIAISTQISYYSSLAYIKANIENEAKQVEEKQKINNISINKPKEDTKSTEIIIIQNELNEYFDGDTPKRVLSDDEYKKVKEMMHNIGLSSGLIKRRLGNIIEFNNKSKENEDKRKKDLIFRILSEESRIVLMQAQELKGSVYYVSYGIDKLLEDIDICINDLLDDESSQDYIDMINLLIGDLKEKVLMVNSINDSKYLNYNNSNQQNMP